MSRRKPKRNSTKETVPPLSRRKLWRFRLMALIGVPLLFFGLLELSLRLAGFGYPTTFLLKSSNHGEKTFVQNDQFGWRFFGPRAARQPNWSFCTKVFSPWLDDCSRNAVGYP